MAFARCAEDAEVRAPLGGSDSEGAAPAAERYGGLRGKAALLAVGAGLLGTAALSAHLYRRQGAALAADIEPPAGGELVQLFGEYNIQELAKPRTAAARSLIEADYTWNDKAEAVGQCTIDVAQATAYLGQAVVFMWKAAQLCPYDDDKDRLPCSIAISITLTSFAWLASYLSLAAESCAQGINTANIDDRALCAADTSGLVADLLELVSVGQAVAIDCDFDPEGEWESWLLHDGSISEDVAKHMKGDGATTESLGEMLKAKAKNLKIPEGLPKSHLFGGKKPKAVLGRRLKKAHGAKNASAVHDFLEEAKAKAEEIDDAHNARIARKYDIAQCVFDVVQSTSYIVRVIFQINMATHNCPEPYVCTVDAMNIISSFAWITQFTSYAVADCAVESYQRGYCAGDIADMVAATTNAVALGMSVESDCAAAEAQS